MMTEPRSELLVNRLVDEEATAEDWNEFTQLAAAEPSLWRDLAQLQHQRQTLAHGMELAMRGVEELDLPVTPHRWSSHPALWAGWAVAAILAISWSLGLNAFVGAGRNSGVGNTGAQPAGLTPSFSGPDEAIQAYLDQGRQAGVVLGELDTKVLLDSAPLQTGDGFSVVILRGFIERREVPTLFGFETNRDEFGNVVVRPVKVHPAGSM